MCGNRLAPYWAAPVDWQEVKIEHSFSEPPTRQRSHEGSLPSRQLLCIKRRLADALHTDGELQAWGPVGCGCHRAADGGGLQAKGQAGGPQISCMADSTGSDHV